MTQATYDVKKSLQLQRHLMPKSPEMMTMTYWIGDRQQRLFSRHPTFAFTRRNSSLTGRRQAGTHSGLPSG